MAKHEITHTCGHTETIDICGPVKGRESRAQWLASKPCRECEHVAAAKAAATENESAGLPALTGTPKQVAWAEQIRAKAAGTTLDEIKAQMMAAAKADSAKLDKLRAQGRMNNEQVEAIRQAMLAETSASWWIDHRNTSAAQLAVDAWYASI